MNRITTRVHHFALVVALALVASAGVPDLVAAAPQAGGLASEGLGRGYWHMFAAYAIAWLLVLGWVVSIGRRLSEVERRVTE